jgi:hypothetical protein
MTISRDCRFSPFLSVRFPFKIHHSDDKRSERLYIHLPITAYFDYRGCCLCFWENSVKFTEHTLTMKMTPNLLDPSDLTPEDFNDVERAY